MEKKISAVIIDDENLARQIIKNYLKEFDRIELAAECSNGFEGVKIINEKNPDLAFLDIQMPRINGFEMLEIIDNPPVIVFTTAYDQYAIKAFEMNAADYLLKPFSKERFAEAIEKANIFLRDKSKQNRLLHNLVKYNYNQKDFLERIVVKEGSEINIIPVEEIIYIEAQDDYVLIHTAGNRFLKKKTMKFLEENLDPKNFIRIHRSYITAVNEIRKIEQMEKESYIIRLKRFDRMLPVSRNGYEKLKEIFR